MPPPSTRMANGQSQQGQRNPSGPLAVPSHQPDWVRCEIASAQEQAEWRAGREIVQQLEQGLQQQPNPVNIQPYPPLPPSLFASAQHVQVALQRNHEMDVTLSQLQFSVVRQMETLTQVDAEIHRLSEQRSVQMTQLLRDQSQLWTLFLASTCGSGNSNGASVSVQHHARPGKSKSRSPKKQRTEMVAEKPTADQEPERLCASTTTWIAGFSMQAPTALLLAQQQSPVLTAVAEKSASSKRLSKGQGRIPPKTPSSEPVQEDAYPAVQRRPPVSTLVGEDPLCTPATLLRQDYQAISAVVEVSESPGTLAARNSHQPGLLSTPIPAGQDGNNHQLSATVRMKDGITIDSEPPIPDPLSPLASISPTQPITSEAAAALRPAGAFAGILQEALAQNGDSVSLNPDAPPFV